MKRPARKAIPLEVKIRVCMVRLGLIETIHDSSAWTLRRLRDGGIARQAALDVLLITMGFDPDHVQWDHSPPLGLRTLNDAGDDYVPPQLSPYHLYPMTTDEHRRKTSGAAPGEGRAHVADSDVHKIAKVKRLSNRFFAGGKRLDNNGDGYPRVTVGKGFAIVEGAYHEGSLYDTLTQADVDRKVDGALGTAPKKPWRNPFPKGRRLQSRPFQKRRK